MAAACGCRVPRETFSPPVFGKANMNSIVTIPAQLVDSYQRRFNYLRLSITEACNFRCTYCLPNGYCPDGEETALSLEEIDHLTNSFASLGTEKIRITGGEPLLRKDLNDVIRCCKETEGIKTVAMTSNGYKLPKLLPELARSGLDCLNLSADSLRADSFKLITGHSKLKQVLDSVEIGLELGLRSVKLNAVLMRDNSFKELDSYLEYIRHRPVSLRLIELMRTNDNHEFYAQQHLSGKSIEQRLIQEGWSASPRLADAGPAIEYQHPDYAGRLGLIMPYSKNFCTSCNRLRVSASGNLHLCLFNHADANLRDLLNDGSADELRQLLIELVKGKWQGHQLIQNDSGSTKHLAMLGG